MADNGFLYTTAKKITEKEQADFNNVLVIFPNQRAIRFFRQYIFDSLQSDTPLFMPEMTSIDLLVEKYLPNVHKGENLRLLYILYSVYKQLMGEENSENFEDFYFWGNVILSDFDQIDKELVDARSLYRNMEEYRELEADPAGFLSSEQISLINRMFNTSLSEDKDKSEIRKNFVKIWNNLYTIYVQFNEYLSANNIAYQGKMYREFASKLLSKEINIPYKKIKIIGFSVLNQVEIQIFKLLSQNYECSFYWDYDNYYYKDPLNEAGIFIREDLNLFPQSEDLKDYSFDNIINNNQQINIISSPYETSSLSYIDLWLKEIFSRNPQLNKCAVILSDESLIPLVLKSISAEYKDKINITMGYPFNQTWLFNQVSEQLNDLIKDNKFTKENVFSCLQHLAETIAENSAEESHWQMPVLKKICSVVEEFILSVENLPAKDLTAKIIQNVIKKELSLLNIDIVSDAVNGVQVMGMLETRVLDFDYVLLLSANDDNIPNLSNDVSFIPYSFRKAYNMINTDKKAGVFAYYFYRLLHRVKRIDYVYTTVGGENKLKEKSRFIRQLEIELKEKKADDFKINYKNLIAKNVLKPAKKEYCFRFEDLKFINDGKRKLSPSALNNLIHCQQKFYLNNVKFLREEIEDDKYLAIAFGNIFHHSANLLYENLKDHSVDSIQELEELIDISINQYLDSPESDKDKRVCGDEIHQAMIRKYLKDVYFTDAKEKNEYLCGEKVFAKDLKIGNNTVHFEGRLDRMSIHTDKDGNKILTVVDYKTGRNKEKVFHSVKELFENPDNLKARKDGYENIFEVLFYCYLVYNNENVARVKPELMYLSNMSERDILLSPVNTKNKNIFYFDGKANEEFEKCLKNLLSGLLDKTDGEKYDMNMSDGFCKFCDYKLLCSISNKESH